MLHKETVEPGKLELLKKLVGLPELKQYRLAGGPALALLYGHRQTAAFDFFTDKPIQKENLLTALNTNFGNSLTVVDTRSQTICKFLIQTFKVDFISVNTRFSTPPQIIEEIPFAASKDLIALKLNAVKGRGAKKDYWDVAKILQFYTLIDLFHFYNNRYHYDDTFALSKSLHDFNAADDDIEPVIMDNMTWTQVKKTIRKAFDNYYKNI